MQSHGLSQAADRRTLLMGLGCCLVGGTAILMTPRRHEAIIGSAKLGDIIPRRLRGWEETPNAAMILPDAPQADTVYDQVLTRTFANSGGVSIMLLIAYAAAQSGLMQVHRPEVCYNSAGFLIENDRPMRLSAGLPIPVTGKSFLAKREDRIEQVFYWTRISDAFPRDLSSQRIVMLERGLAGVSPDAVLVRISTMVNPGQTRLPELIKFGAELIANAGPLGRTLLIGSQAARETLS